MEKNRWRSATSLTWISSIALVGIGLAGGLWFGRAPSLRAPVLLADAISALAVILGLVWLFRARAARRWQTALDGYAEREIARTLSRQSATRQNFTPRSRVLQTQR